MEARNKHDWALTKRIRSLEKRKKSRIRIYVSKSLNYGAEKNKILVHFSRYALTALTLKKNYRIYVVDERLKYGIETTGVFLNENRSMYIYASGRLLVDVLRSIAHEFVHAKQHEIGVEGDHRFLHFDNQLEDEANEFAGEVLNAYTEVMGHWLYEL